MSKLVYLKHILVDYVIIDNGKFAYKNGIAKLKHSNMNNVRYIVKEPKGIDEIIVTKIENNKFFDHKNIKDNDELPQNLEHFFL